MTQTCQTTPVWQGLASRSPPPLVPFLSRFRHQPTHRYGVNSPLGFIIALQAERASLTPLRLHHHSPRQLPSGHWLILSGMGAWNAHHAAHRLLQKGVTGLVSWGSAGALCPSLRAGHLILPDRIVGATGDVYLSHPDWRERLLQTLATDLAITQGTLVESLGAVASISDKRTLHTGSGAVAVDMESAAIAAVAKTASLPFMVIRAIADTADMALPSSVIHATNAQGFVSIPKLLMHTAFRPAEWKELKQLNTAFSAAHKTLGIVTARISARHFLFSRPHEDLTP